MEDEVVSPDFKQNDSFDQLFPETIMNQKVNTGLIDRSPERDGESKSQSPNKQIIATKKLEGVQRENDIMQTPQIDLKVSTITQTTPPAF